MIDSMKFGPLRIGSLVLKNNLIAAPMAGLSALPYRILAMENGCALAISEMIASEGLIRAQEKTRHLFVNDERVRPFGVQLFGANPSSFAKAIEILEEEAIDLIDINMGCPVKKVCRKGGGSALMKEPALVKEICRAARRATKRALTVKMRIGWDGSSINCREIAAIAEGEGMDAVSIHGRTREQFYSGLADWNAIAEVKAKLKIPVIGNGDIKCREDAIRIIEQTGCDGIMIGRAAIGNPWLFAQILDPSAKNPTIDARRGAAIRHLSMLVSLLGEKGAVLAMRSIAPWYAKGLHGVRKFRSELHKITNSAEMIECINEHLSPADADFK